LNNHLDAEYGEKVCSCAVQVILSDSRKGLVTYCIHPGGVPTELALGMPDWMHGVLGDTPELAADSVSWLTSEKRDWWVELFILGECITDALKANGSVYICWLGYAGAREAKGRDRVEAAAEAEVTDVEHWSHAGELIRASRSQRQCLRLQVSPSFSRHFHTLHSCNFSSSHSSPVSAFPSWIDTKPPASKRAQSSLMASR
jgi:hypothetical protein